MQIQFKTNLKQWMAANRWHPKSLAEKLGVRRQSVHNWIDGSSTPKNKEVIYELFALGGDELILFQNSADKPKILRQTSSYFEIVGGQALKGEITLPGAKNAALPMLCAALLTPERCEFENVPNISDIEILLNIFQTLGAEVERDPEQNFVAITARKLDPSKLGECSGVRKMRASILMLGPLLSRYGQVELMKPGGCVLGARPNDIHYQGFESLGAVVTEDDEGVRVEYDGREYPSPQILLSEASVTATENIATFMAGQEQDGEIFFAAAENSVTQLLLMLQTMGAQIDGIGTHRLRLRGSQSLNGGRFRIPPDNVLAGTYTIAALLTQGDVTIRDVYHTEMLSFYGALRRVGARFEFDQDWIKVCGSQSFKSIPRLQTAIYPGFPTDVQSPFGVLLTQCQGESMIQETLFENRFTYLSELEKMGARFHLLNAHQALILGKTPLRGAEVQSWDIRAGAAMVLAGLIAEGTTRVTNINYIDRGYEDFEQVLRQLGAQITRVSD